MTDNMAIAEMPTLPASRDTEAYIGNNSNDSYAKKLVRDWAMTLTANAQQVAHFTFGQVVAVTPIEFGFRLGTPSVRPVWARDNALPEWVARTYQLCQLGNEDAALKEIALTTSRFKADGTFAQLSANLVLFDLKRLSDVVLVSLLRNTFSIRANIACWDLLLYQAEKILQERNREPSKLLRGLKR